MGHNGLAALLGRSTTIMPKLGVFLTRRIHVLEIEKNEKD
jgi:hypothetical protein